MLKIILYFGCVLQLTVTSVYAQTYCQSTYSNTTDDWIVNVTFNTINNTTGQDGPDSYGDYTSISTQVIPGHYLLTH